MLVALAAVPSAARATAGEPDPSFSGDGRVTIVPPSDGTFVARDVAVQPDGRIVVAGFSCAPAAGSDGTCLSGGGASVRITRLTPDGGLDPEFGNGGFVTTPVGTRSQAYDVLLTTDGALVVAGFARVGERDVLLLAKYTARGERYPGFGSDGIVTQPIGSGFAAGAALAQGPGGTLYVAGQATDAGGGRRMALARFTAGGALDTGWGDGGVTLGGPGYGYALGLVAEGGAPLLAGVGAGSQDPTAYRFGLLRAGPGGGLDPSFGGVGWATFAAGNPSVSSFANAVASTGGGWVAAGVATDAANTQAMAVLRGTWSGALDPGFGAGGQTVVSAGDGAVANDIVALADGRIVAVGQVRTAGGYVFGAARLTAGGALDPSFGSGGVATIGFELPVTRALAGDVGPDGRMVLAGVGCSGSAQPDCTGGTSVLVVARQLADPPAPAPPTGPATPAPPGTGPSPARPRVRTSRPVRRVTRRRLVREGVRLRVRTSLPVRADARLLARTRRGKSFLLARDRVRRGQRQLSVRLKPGRKAVRRARTGNLRLRLRLATAAGATVTRTFTIRLR